MILGFAVDENGGRNGHCDKQRIIPSIIVQELPYMLIYRLFLQYRKAPSPSGFPDTHVTTNYFMTSLGGTVGLSVRRIISYP